MTRADGGPRTSQGTWESLGRTVGSAIGEVRRLLVTQRRPGAAGKRAALSRLLGMRRRLAAEVAALEAELEQLHTTITNNPFPHSGEAGRSNLQALIARARRLRDRVRDKRDTLARIERHIARERWLASDGSRGPGARRPPRKPARSAPAKPRRNSKVNTILERSPFQNRTERATLRRLGEDLANPSSETRHAACQKLAQFRSPAARKLLLMALDDRSERVQLAALNALAGARGRSAARAFRRFIHHKNPALRVTALRGLAGAGRSAVTRAELMRALSDDDAAVRKFALKVLAWRRDGDVADSRALPELALALHDDDTAVRLGAVEALAATGSTRSVAALIRAVADEAEKVREAAAAAIVGIVGAEAAEIGAGLPPGERAQALKQWWARARVDLALRGPAARVAPPPAPPAPAQETPAADEAAADSGTQAASSAPEADIADELAAQMATAATAAAAESAEGHADVASPAELDALSGPAEFESVFGEESTAVAVTGLEPEAGAEQFESVFGNEGAEDAGPADKQEAAEDEGAEGEEYENVFGSEED